MKRQDLYFAIVMLAIFLPFFLSADLYEWYKTFNAEHAMIMAFLKFGILATLGEMLGCRISTGNYTTPTFGVVPRMVVWGLVDPEDDHVLRVADLELDEDSHEVRRAGKVIEVSPTEFKLLRYLMLNPGRVLSKSQILDHVWDYDFRGEMNIVESYISYLRRKIDVVGEPLIHTKRGVGYVLRAPRA